MAADFYPDPDALADLINGLGSLIPATADALAGAMENVIHDAAVDLLNAILPARVHANNAVVKSGGWVAVEGSTDVVRFTLGAGDVSNTVLGGMVAKKVAEGVTRITSDTSYADGVNSIAW